MQSEKADNQSQKVLVTSETSNKQSPKSTLKELFFLDIVETIREPLLVLDADLRVLYASRNFYTSFKITVRETIGSLIYDLGNHQWDIPKLRILLEEIIPEHILFEGYQVEHDFPIIGKRIMLVNAQRIVKPLGSQQFILLGIEDITERIRIEQALQASEERFRKAFETANDGMLLIEKTKGQILNSNKASQKLLNYSIEELQKQKIWKIGFIKDAEQFHQTANQLEQRHVIDYSDTSVKTRDGREIAADVILTDRAKVIQCNIRDITDRKQADEKLQESEERYKALFQNNQAVMLLIDPERGAILDANPAASTFYGWNHEKLLKKKINEINTLSTEDVQAEMQLALEEKRNHFFFKHRLADGTIRDVEVYSGPLVILGKTLLYSMVYDITEQKLSEVKLQESEEFLNNIIENIPHMIFVKDAQELRFMRFNKAGEELLGFSKQELYGKNDNDFFPLDQAELFIENDKETLKNKSLIDIPEEIILTKDKGERILHTKKIPILDEKGNPKYLLGISEDITERQHALEALRESQERFSSAFEFSAIGMSLVGLDGNFLQVNHAVCEITGYSKKELLQKTFQEITHPDDLKTDLGYVRQMLAGEITTYQMEKRYMHKLGHDIWILLSVSLVHDKEGKPLYFLSQIQDINKRKRAEQLLNIRNQLAISLGTVETLEEVFTTVSSQLKELNFASMLFLIDQSHKKLITKYMTFNSTMLNEAESMVGIRHENFSFSIDALDVYKQVIGKKKTIYQKNTTALLRQVIPAPFKKFALHITRMLNIPKFIVSPLIVHNTVLGVFIVLSTDLTEEDVPAITAFSGQLAAAWYKTELVQNLKTNLQELDQAQASLKTNFSLLQKSLVQTIDAMTFMVEKRDPYTAGHQTRVAQLASAIAIELHLSADQLNAIKISGVVHDIGKINVPAEILSKPGKLSPNEFRLIKSHPKDGFDILKKIDFPWPVAKIVYQHHERINGTGYPRHLKGDKISIEAKILAVADVVEAMLSHRPYRAALSKDKTMKEITDNKNILYDEKVVNACVKLFKTGKFKF